ncbi:MAG TPA: putative toxin-antitoxin system toxin component, PIN family [Azospirillaceae bacterium]|nr:putative toxin-antitoxin system toxin component, PIN family [Azospirillaceae bacterium]
MRVIVDTNVYVSFVARPTLEAKALRDFLVANATILYSEETMAELGEVMARPKIAERSADAEVRRLKSTLETLGERVAITVPVRACCDPKDDMFLSLALSGKADVIVTNDHDLLVMGIFSGTRIMNPKQFLRKYARL